MEGIKDKHSLPMICSAEQVIRRHDDWSITSLTFHHAKVANAQNDAHITGFSSPPPKSCVGDDRRRWMAVRGSGGTVMQATDYVISATNYNSCRECYTVRTNVALIYRMLVYYEYNKYKCITTEAKLLLLISLIML